MGLQTINERIFKSLVKLNGNNANGIYLHGFMAAISTEYATHE